MKKSSSAGRTPEPQGPKDTVKRVMKEGIAEHHASVLLNFARRHKEVFPRNAMFTATPSGGRRKVYRFSKSYDAFIFNLLNIHDFLGSGPSKTCEFVLAAREGQFERVQAMLSARRAEIAALGAAFRRWDKISAGWGQFFEKKELNSKRLPLEASPDLATPAPVSLTENSPTPNLRAAQALVDASKKFATKDPSPEHLAAQAYYWVTLKRIDLARETLDDAAKNHPKNAAVGFVRALCLIEEADKAGASAYLHFEEGSGGMGAISAEEDYHDRLASEERERQVHAFEQAFALLIEAFENWPSRMPATLPIDLPFWRHKVAEKALELFNRGFGRDAKGRTGVLHVLEQLAAERQGRIDVHSLGWWVQVLQAAVLTKAPALPIWIEALRKAINDPVDLWHRKMFFPGAHPSSFVDLPKEDWSWANPWPEALLSQKPEGFLALILSGSEAGAQAKLEASWIHARSQVQSDLLLQRHHLRAWETLIRLEAFEILGADYPVEKALKVTSDALENLPWSESKLSKRLKPRWAYAHFTVLFISALLALLKEDTNGAKAQRDRARLFLDANPEIRRKRATHVYQLYADDEHGFRDLLHCPGHLLRPAKHRWLRGVGLFPFGNGHGLRELISRLENADADASLWDNLNKALDDGFGA